MSDESNLSEAIKPLLGMVAGAVVTNAALIGLLTKQGLLSKTELLAAIEKEIDEIGLDDAKMKKGMQSFVAAMKRAAVEGESANG